MQPTTSDVHRGSTPYNPNAGKPASEMTDEELTEMLRSIIARMTAEDISDFLPSKSTLGDISKPYPSEHAARQTDPGQYKAIRRQNGKFGPGIDAIFGIRDDGKTELQSIRFDASKFTPEQARAWLKAHSMKTGLEAATGSSSSSEPEKATGEVKKQAANGGTMYCNNCGEETDKLMLSADKLLLCCAKCAKQEEAEPEEEPEPEPKEEAEPEEPTEKATIKMDDGTVIKESFTDSPWSTPESSLDAGAFCSVCLIDDNPAGSEKIKSKCHLPVRSRPGGPVNKGALRNAAARLNQVQSSSESKASAKRKLARLMSAAGIDSSLNKDPSLDKLAQREDVEITAEIIKSDDEKRLAYGVSYPAKPSTWSDTQGDWVSADEIEKMSHKWMIKSQSYDIQHQIFGLSHEDAVVVESYIAPVDFAINDRQVTKGSWVVVTYFPNETVWNDVKAKNINAYSIRGKAKRKPISAL